MGTTYSYYIFHPEYTAEVATMNWTVLDGETLEKHVISTPEEALSIFDEIDNRAAQPSLVGIFPEGDPRARPFFLLGAGDDMSFFGINGEYTPGEGDQPTGWWYDNQDSELPAGILIPKQAARRKLLEALADRG